MQTSYGIVTYAKNGAMLVNGKFASKQLKKDVENELAQLALKDTHEEKLKEYDGLDFTDSLSINDAAVYLGLKVYKIRLLLREGELNHSVKRGHVTFYSVVGYKNLLKALKDARIHS